jgi:hypothetical protein
MNFKEYKDKILNEEKLEEQIKTVEAAVDISLENSKDKKSAIDFINKSKDKFVMKNKKKIIDMINKLPDSLFK